MLCVNAGGNAVEPNLQIAEDEAGHRLERFSDLGATKHNIGDFRAPL